MQNFKSVVLPAKPPIDKVAAKVLLERHFGKRLPVAEFYDDTFAYHQLLSGYRKRAHAVEPIDIGNEKYDRGSSATERIAERFSMRLSGAERALISMINQNNATGDLKGGHLAIPWIMRELYELNGYDHKDIVERTGVVVHAWLDVEEGRIDSSRRESDLEQRFEDFYHRTRKCNDRPLTVGGYLRDAWLRGDSPRRISEQIRFWGNGNEDIADHKRAAEQEYRFMVRDEFLVGKFRALWLETDNPMLVKVAMNSGDYSIVATRRRDDGHAAVLTKNLDVSTMYAALQEREVGRWYHEERMGAIINGGKMYVGVTPTDLDRSNFIGLIQKYPPIRRKKKQKARG